MLITMEPAELPFTIGNTVWVHHEISGVGNGSPYNEGKVTAIEVRPESFFANNRRVTEDKTEHKIFLAKVVCRVSLYPQLNEELNYEYWLTGDNSHIFLTEEEVLDFRAKYRKLT